MPTTAQYVQEDATEERAVAADIDPGQEDSYWQGAYSRELYYTPGLEYEDYAPAYCVGYIGHAQYGGSFEDAERSLLANWERIRGDSRLSVEDARMAMRAAWDRMAARHEREAIRKALAFRLFRKRLKMPSFKLNATPLR